MNNRKRYTVILGFNTKQFWIYDEEKDTYIDPPAEVLNKIDQDYAWNDVDNKEKALEEIIEQDPSWLYDKDYTYPADDLEI